MQDLFLRVPFKYKSSHKPRGDPKNIISQTQTVEKPNNGLTITPWPFCGGCSLPVCSMFWGNLNCFNLLDSHFKLIQVPSNTLWTAFTLVMKNWEKCSLNWAMRMTCDRAVPFHGRKWCECSTECPIVQLEGLREQYLSLSPCFENLGLGSGNYVDLLDRPKPSILVTSFV